MRQIRQPTLSTSATCPRSWPIGSADRGCSIARLLAATPALSALVSPSRAGRGGRRCGDGRSGRGWRNRAGDQPPRLGFSSSPALMATSAMPASQARAGEREQGKKVKVCLLRVRAARPHSRSPLGPRGRLPEPRHARVATGRVTSPHCLRARRRHVPRRQVARGLGCSMASGRRTS